MTSSDGFSLVELMVVLAIAAIILAIVAPSFRDFTLTTRAASTMSQLMNDLNLARSEALKRNVRVLVCATNTAGNCISSSNWANGWKLCYDADSDASCDASSTANPNPIRTKAPVSTGLTLTGPANSFPVTPVFQNNEQIYNLIYTYTKGSVTISPYYQYTVCLLYTSPSPRDS